ncbi:MAG: SusC/RagA family TonB-linked outer membrane protein [Bacteroidales bacterium]|nr:SusC/RagA family TonB-linked outer membrane protein [Bacteroidales bacterium]MBN2633434.1 SusC/RagA family TonB-linked outer membrane protein [Bacteroidales bacterium]
MKNKYKLHIHLKLLLLIPVLLMLSPVTHAAVTGPSGLSGQAYNSLNQQAFVVTGTVTSGTDKTPLAGVSIQIKQTQRGTFTNSSGSYSIEVSDENSILIFSFIGYTTVEIPVNGRRIIDVTMNEDMQALDEVVVTALGITRKQKSLGYSIGTVSGENLARVVQENTINSLAGKVTGVQISNTGGTGSSVSMVIRGATSLSNDNQPLFVIDGVPVVNTLNNISGFGSDNRVDYGNAISDLNSDDIESVSILKGPGAAALYGSRAGNGVVLITTKSGHKGQGIKVNLSSNTVFDMPYKYFPVQKKFATGTFSFTPDDFPPGYVLKVNEGEGFGAGIELDKEFFAVNWNSPFDANGIRVPTELVSHPDNVPNFVQTGITTTNEISVSNNSDLMNYRIGVSNMSNRGLVPNSDLFRNNLAAAASVKVRDNFTISSNININKSWSNNRPASNRGTNPLQWAYNVPQHIDILDLKDYWEEGREGIQQKTPYLGIYNNPYFLAYEVNNSFNRDRIFGNLKAEWKITDNLSLMGRYSLDQFSEKRESKIAPSYTGEPNNGAYGVQDITSYERNVDVLASYLKQFSDFSLSVSAGGNALYKKGTSISSSSMSGAGLIVPDVYTLSNIKSGSLNYGSYWSQKAIYSVYGLANLGWKDMIFLDLTGRNDWSSTLPKENWSYFYPSASLSLLVDQMIEMGKNVDLFKIRGGWAKVGNDTDPYQLYNTYDNAVQWGDATRLAKSGQILTPNLKPEEAVSREAGIDLNLFGNRLRFEGTYYAVENRNQIIRNIPVASSTGSDNVNINAGLIRSKGWELMIGGTPVRTPLWSWDISANFTRNRTWVVEIAEGIDVIKFWEDAKGGSWSYVGDEIGTIYDAEMITVTDPSSPYYGYPVLSPADLEWESVEMRDAKNKIGNYNPRFIMGLQSSLTYRGFSLNMTFDWRNGGQFISQTQRYMAEDGHSQLWLDNLINPEGRTGKELRDWLVEHEDEFIKNGFHVVGGPTIEYGGFEENYSGVYVSDGVFVPGVWAVDDGEGGVTYVENLGEEGTLVLPYIVSYPWGFARPSMFDSDFIKLREISLSYNVPRSFLNRLRAVENIAISLYSRNIILWTKAKAGIDPERAFQAEGSTGGTRGTQFKQGIERYNLEPWVIPLGIKIDITF